MEPVGLGIAVVGLAGQLFDASLAGYNLLETAQSFGQDFEELSFRLDAEKLALKKWAEAWVLNQSNQTMDHSHHDYRFAVTTLARISALFAELLEYSARYGLDCSRDSPTRKRDTLRQIFPASWRSQRPPNTPTSTRSGLDLDSLKLLSAPALLELEQIKPHLAKEVDRLKDSAKSLQNTLPAKSKLRWSIVDKDKFGNLIQRLKEYNEILNRVLPVGPVGPGSTQSIKTSFTVPPKLPFHRNHMFCGREDLIDTVHSYFKGSAPAELTQKIVVLHGLGGIGKTSIALEYAFRYSNSYTTVFWADVTSGISLSQSARGIAEHLIVNYAKRGFPYEHIADTLGLRGVLDANGKLASDETAALRVTEALKEWLATAKNQSGELEWLLILDNYDDVDAVDLRLILPTCNAGNVIITSRKSNLQALGKTVAVDEIDEVSGMALFLKSANKAEAKAEEGDSARQIAVKLGFLPLALTQAGSYISERQISFQKYLTLLDGKFRTVTSAKCGTKDRNKVIFTTWEISFAALSHSAQELLLLCGFLANSDIPDALFVQESKLPFEWVQEGDMWLMDSLAELFSFSLAKRKASDDAFWIHPVVHNWARERLDTLAIQKKVEEAVILCDALFKKRNDKQPHNWAFERRIWPHIESVQTSWDALSTKLADGEHLFQAASNMGHLCEQHGLYSPAVRLSAWALDGREKTLGKDHPSTLDAVHNMASVFDNQGQHEKALEWYGRALEGYEKTLGKDHPSTLDAVHNMATVFDKQGRYEKALEWCGRALDGCEKTLGKDHPSTLDAVHNMAIVFYNQGQYEKALEWYGRALDGSEKTLGKDHPSTLNAVHNMASVFYNQGQYEKALEWYGRALDGSEKTLGKDHPSTLNAVHNMASVFDNQGQHEKALEWYGRALDGREKTLGKDHPSTLDAVHNMASVFDNQGQHEKALEWYGRALEGYEKTLGKDHPSTLDAVHNMATVFDKQGRYEKALEWCGRALDGCEKTLGKDHPSTLDAVHNMASVFDNQGQYEKALEWYGRALDGREKTLGKDHPLTLDAVHNMASVFYNQGQYEKALEWYGRALDGSEKTLGKDHPSTLNAVHNMASVFDNQGRYEKALEWYGRALEGFEKTLGKDHPSTRQTLYRINAVRSKFGAEPRETATSP